MAGTIVGVGEVPILPDTSKFTAAATAGISKSMKSIGEKMSSIGKKLTTHLTLPIVALGTVAVKMAVDFNTTFSKIGALAGDIGIPVEQAKAQVLALAKATGQDPGGLANALYFAASAGLKTSEIMPVLAASAKAAEAGMGDVQTIAQLLTSTLNAYAGTGLNAAKAMNILTSTIRVGKAEPAELADSLGTVISAAAQAKIGFEQVGAAVATATDLGVPAARAITGLRFLISSLSAPTAKSAAALKEYGVSIAGLQQMIAQKGLAGTLQTLATKFDLTSIKGKAAWAAVVGGARGAVVANTLVGKSAKLANTNLREVAHSAGDFQTAVGKMSKSQGVLFQKFVTNMKVAAIQLGQVLIPVVERIVGWFGQLATWFQKLSPQGQQMVAWVLAIAAAIGPLIFIAGKLILVTRAVGLAMMFLAANPIILAIAGIIAITALLILNWGKVKRATLDVWHSITSALGAAWHWIKSTAVRIWQALYHILSFTPFITQVKIEWAIIRDIFKVAFVVIRRVVQLGMGWLRSTIIPGIKQIAGVVKTVLRGLAAAWRTIWGAFGPVVQTVMSGVVGFVKIGVNAVIHTINALIHGYNVLPGHADIPSIPTLAKGGVVEKTGLAVVHEGERYSGVRHGTALSALSVASAGVPGGPVALTITNWERGTGYISAVARRAIDDHDSWAAGRRRMGAPA